tara:strand:- start:34 stop:1002 length:969 start_codon:yes stop_codon:yes gene_type:complete
MHATNRLSALRVQNALPGKYGDGGGLWLHKRAKNSGQWILRFTLHGKRHDMGLGGIGSVSLKSARELADKWRRLAKTGLNPIRERKKEAVKRARSENAFTIREGLMMTHQQTETPKWREDTPTEVTYSAIPCRISKTAVFRAYFDSGLQWPSDGYVQTAVSSDGRLLFTRTEHRKIRGKKSVKLTRSGSDSVYVPITDWTRRTLTQALRDRVPEVGTYSAYPQAEISADGNVIRVSPIDGWEWHAFARHTRHRNNIAKAGLAAKVAAEAGFSLEPPDLTAVKVDHLRGALKRLNAAIADHANLVVGLEGNQITISMTTTQAL